MAIRDRNMYNEQKGNLPPSYCIAFATGSSIAIALLLVFSRYINKVPCSQYLVVPVRRRSQKHISWVLRGWCGKMLNGIWMECVCVCVFCSKAKRKVENTSARINHFIIKSTWIYVYAKLCNDDCYGFLCLRATLDNNLCLVLWCVCLRLCICFIHSFSMQKRRASAMPLKCMRIQIEERSFYLYALRKKTIIKASDS